MVSALASSSVALPRRVSDKVLVNDCDLLCKGQEPQEQERWYSSGLLETHILLFIYFCSYFSLTWAVATVWVLRAQRTRGWGRAERPGWGKWRLSELAEGNPGLTVMERLRWSVVPLRKKGGGQCRLDVESSSKATRIYWNKKVVLPLLGCVVWKKRSSNESLVSERPERNMEVLAQCRSRWLLQLSLSMTQQICFLKLVFLIQIIKTVFRIKDPSSKLLFLATIYMSFTSLCRVFLAGHIVKTYLGHASWSCSNPLRLPDFLIAYHCINCLKRQLLRTT